MATVKMLCTIALKETEHTATVDTNGEILMTCVENGHTVKFPAGDINAMIQAHNEANADWVAKQIAINEVQAKLDAQLGS